MHCAQSATQSAAWVDALFPEGVVATEARATVPTSLLFPQELAHVEAAVEKRRLEFAAGRVCARRSLASIGFAEAPLTAMPGGMPLWPNGAIGSISHTDGYCVAVAGLTKQFRGIGVDAEVLGRVQPDLWGLIFRAEEIDRLHALSPSRRMEMATIMFSAKEAFYKCQYAVTRNWLGFEDVTVEAAENEFWVSVFDAQAKAALTGHACAGKFAVDCSRVVCGIAFQA